MENQIKSTNQFQLTDQFELSEKQIEQFDKYYQMLIEANEHINLTAITKYQEVLVKHFYDSLLVSKVVDLNKEVSLCDIGSGAGFPSLPLKIMFPSLKVTIIEPTTKRINFLKTVVDALNLKDVTLINARAEDAIIDFREQFDFVSARAVATLPILLELTIPYLKVKGTFLALKGSNYNEEITSATRATKKLNLTYEINYFKLPLEMGERVIISYHKEKATSKEFPRKYAIIKKNPL